MVNKELLVRRGLLDPRGIRATQALDCRESKANREILDPLVSKALPEQQHSQERVDVLVRRGLQANMGCLEARLSQVQAGLWGGQVLRVQRVSRAALESRL